MGADDAERTRSVSPGGFGRLQEQARQRIVRHPSGWQERPEVESPDREGERTAPLAPEGGVLRTSIAERLRKHAAEHGEE